VFVCVSEFIYIGSRARKEQGSEKGNRDHVRKLGVGRKLGAGKETGNVKGDGEQERKLGARKETGSSKGNWEQERKLGS
jgi:hypothetical protein